MTDTVKKIVSEYTKISINELQPETLVGRSAVGNSIVLHRMYAAIAKAGIEVPGYQDVNTFGELMDKIPGNSKTVRAENSYKKMPVQTGELKPEPGTSIGIDIENISEMPAVDDFREDTFYQMNFTPEEIAYCILQADTYASFAGLFAAKEAIVKADNNYQKNNFNTIFIDHLPGGKPAFAGFEISISHTQTLCIAVAVKHTRSHGITVQKEIVKKNNPTFLISLVALAIALIALIISLYK